MEQTIINREELLKSYVGNNYKEFTRGKFSWNLFAFGSLYLLYRKCYSMGIILTLLSIINYVLVIFFPDLFLLSYAVPIVNIVLSFNFKQEYLNTCNEKIDEIIKNNPNSDMDELKQICKVKGGTSAVTVVLTYVIEILLLLIGLMFLNLSSKNVERLKVEYNNIPELKNPSFNSYKKGKYHYTEVLFQYNDNNNICYLTLTLTDEYRLNRKTTQKEQAKKYYTDLTKKDINIKAFQNKNGVKLNHYHSEDYNTDYYFYSSKNMTSILKFEISKDDGKCSQLKDNVIDNTVIIKGN